MWKDEVEGPFELGPVSEVKSFGRDNSLQRGYKIAVNGMFVRTLQGRDAAIDIAYRLNKHTHPETLVELLRFNPEDPTPEQIDYEESRKEI
jgi:hypothetical protein